MKELTVHEVKKYLVLGLDLLLAVPCSDGQ